MMCVNSQGAAELLDVSRMTVWRYTYEHKIFHPFWYGIHRLIPLREVANISGKSQRELIKKADDLDIMLWRCQEK